MNHLDMVPSEKLKIRLRCFIPPLGVGGHLQKWEWKKNVLWNWIGGRKFSQGRYSECNSAQHFSGRGFSDRAIPYGLLDIKSEIELNIFLLVADRRVYGPLLRK